MSSYRSSNVQQWRSFMLKAIKMALAAALLVPAFSVAHAEGDQSTEANRSRCSAEAIDRFYCPVFGDQYWGPYFDNGCSVKCEANQKAVCISASCDDGDSVPSSCSCE
jgi:hypothetical protein